MAEYLPSPEVEAVVQFLRDETNSTLLQQVRREYVSNHVSDHLSTRRLLRVTPFYFLLPAS